MIVIPCTTVTYTVVVFILVKLLVLGLYVTVTGVFEEMILVIVRIFVGKIMLAENVIASANVAFTVVIFVLVLAVNLFSAEVAFEVFVVIYVISAFHFSAAIITFQIVVCI